MRAAEIFPLRPTVRYARGLGEALRAETVGGIIMLVATIAALVWANTGWADSYETLRNIKIGPQWLHLDLELFKWAQNGLLTIFFFVAGLEIKEEFTHGELSQLRSAVLPIIAAIAGMVVPALIYLAVSWGADDAGRGWAIPTATDIAFALAVLAITASAMPNALRAFLLTTAVVDDLCAITIIAIFFTETVVLWALLAGAASIALYGFLQHKRVRGLWIYVPLALAGWYFIEISGIHATVAGVALGLLTRVYSTEDEELSPCERADHYVRPISAGLAVPIFAFLSAGVGLDMDSLRDVFTDRIALGVIFGLVVGKFLGIFGGAWLSVRAGLARISEDLHWRDLAAASVLAGIGFTVSLLIGGLAYGGSAQSERVTTAVLMASLVASLVAAGLLHVRVRKRIVQQDGG